MKFSLFQRSFIHALGTTTYTAAVALLMFNGKVIFGEEDNFLIPLFILLLLIISAAVTSLLVLGKPIQLYLSNQKSEAIKLLWQTLVWIIVFILIIGVLLLNH